MIYHLSNAALPGGYVGVDIFFVISGYVVASSLSGGSVSSFTAFLSEFYARRLARIVPALVSVLVFSAVLATLFIPNAWLSELSDRTATFAFFGLSNWVMQTNTDTYFAPRSEFNPYTHTWSLGVEEQYYVLAPVFVYLWLKAFQRGKRAVANLVLCVLALFMCGSLFVSYRASAFQPTIAFYSIASRFWELASGALLYLMTCERGAGNMNVVKVWLMQHQTRVWSMTASLGLISVFIGLIYSDTTKFPWPWVLVPVFGTLLLIGGATFGPHDAIRCALAAPISVWLGKRSYSLYLWHWPVLVGMRWTIGLNNSWKIGVAIGFTFALAILSYRLIEKPLRHNAWIEGRAKWERITGFIFLSVVGVLFSTYLFDNRARYSLSNVSISATDWYAGAQMPYPGLGNRRCEVSIEWHGIAGGTERRYVPHTCLGKSNNRKIFVLGDSHAGMLAPVFDQIVGEEGFQVSVFSYAGCSFIDFNAPMKIPYRSAGCLEFTEAIAKHTARSANPGDIALLSSLRMQRYGDQWASYNRNNMYDFMYNQSAMQLRLEAAEDAKRWLEPFADVQLNVVITAPTPVFQAPPFRCSDWFNSSNPICIGQNQQARSELEKLRQPIITSMKSLAQTFPNVTIWDAFPLLCPDATCHTQMNGRPLFFDGDHLTAYGNLVVYPEFKKTIVSLK